MITRNDPSRKTLRTGLFFLALALLLAPGCASTLDKGASAPPTVDAQVAGDFNDIQVPLEMTLQKSDSFVVNTNGVRTGVLVYKGGLEAESTMRFFENSMKNDAWIQVSSMKSKRSMLLFKKESRWCVMEVSAGRFSTEVTIWVAPDGSGMGSGMGAVETAPVAPREDSAKGSTVESEGLFK